MNRDKFVIEFVNRNIGAKTSKEVFTQNMGEKVPITAAIMNYNFDYAFSDARKGVY